MLESKHILWDLNAVIMQTISLVPLNLHTHWPRGWPALYSGRIGHDKTQTADHAHCADRADCATFLIAFLLLCFFKNVIYVWLRSVHHFLTLSVTLGQFPIFGHHMRKFCEVLSSSRYLARQNRGVKFLALMQISPTRQDVICVDRDVEDYLDLHKTAQRTLQ